MADDAIDYLSRRTRPPPTSRSSLLRTRRNARAAPAAEGMDRKVQRQVRQGLERCATRSSRTRRARRDPAQHQADDWPDKFPKWDSLYAGPAETVRAASGGLRRVRRVRGQRDRPRHRPWSAWASSTTRSSSISRVTTARARKVDERTPTRSRHRDSNPGREAARILRVWGPERPSRTWPRRGRGRSTRRSSG